MRSSNAVRTVLLALAAAFMPAEAQVVSITIAPPVLPVYVQPIIPGEGFLWNPGYWAYGPEGYFWVPGVWVRPPQVGLLWTPGYWGFHGGIYGWNAGYWGPHVGFYGGVNYGFGFGGVGFAGGRWEGGHFAYNSAVANVGVGGGFHSYRENVVVNNVHTSFNGPGGLGARPTPGERSAMGEHHFGPTAAQNAHHEAASHDRSGLASANHGHPSNAAMSRPRGAAGGANASHAGGANKGAEHNSGPANHSAAANHSGPANHSAAANKAPQHNSGGGQAKGGGGGQAKGGGGKPASHAAPAKGGKK